MAARIHKTYISKHILLLEIDNPPANSLSSEIKKQFGQVIDEIESQNELRAIILSGRGDKFCVGDDLKEAAEFAKTETGILNNLREFIKVIARFENLGIPTIAACNGWTIGGGLELALCCDIRIASDTARFKGVAVNIGLTASGARLPRIIGIGRTKQMLFTAEAIDAKTALQYGLVTATHPSEELLNEAKILAEVIASKAPLAIISTKNIINSSTELNEKEMNFLSKEELEKLSKTKDYRIALEAFSQKKTPVFHGS